MKTIVYRLAEYVSDFMNAISFDGVYITRHDCLNFLKGTHFSQHLIE